MASVVQSLFSLAPFQAAYKSNHAATCPEPLPAACLLCQLHKMHDGLLSGRYSHPRRQDAAEPPKPDEPVFQDGLRPSMFKALIGKGHEEFATMRQQDAEEFLTYLFKVIRTDAKKRGVEEKDTPPESFKFGMEQRLQCGKCKRVRYKVDSQDAISLAIPAKEIVSMDESKDEEKKTEYEPVELTTCLDLFTQADGLEYKCPSCNDTVVAQKQNRFATFPDILLVHAKKFQLVNWVPQKLRASLPPFLKRNMLTLSSLAIPLIVEDFLVLDEYKGQGLQEGEQELPDESTKGALESLPIRPPYSHSLSNSRGTRGRPSSPRTTRRNGFPHHPMQKGALSHRRRPRSSHRVVIRTHGRPRYRRPHRHGIIIINQRSSSCGGPRPSLDATRYGLYGSSSFESAPRDGKLFLSLLGPFYLPNQIITLSTCVRVCTGW
jgi:hypothetical protein